MSRAFSHATSKSQTIFDVPLRKKLQSKNVLLNEYLFKRKGYLYLVFAIKNASMSLTERL